MKKNKINLNIKKIGLTGLLLLFALVLGISALWATGLFGGKNRASAATTAVGDRVTPLDLISIHQVDFIMGPLATKATSGANSGKYVDAAGNLAVDKNGNETNNVYGIPANQYFNIESYIFTNDSTVDGVKKRVLRGFKKGISTVYRANASTPITNPIDENGFSDGQLSVYFDGNNLSSENKYMLIIPDSITSIGTGSGSFFCTGSTCVSGGTTCPGHQNGGRKLAATGNDDYQFTDFANFIKEIPIPYGYFSPRERIAGIYFNTTSQLTSIDGGVPTVNKSESSYGNTYTRDNTKGKSAIAALNNMKFCVLPNNGTLTRIGDNAFYNDTQLRDFNIPGSVASLGTSAFGSCSSLVHLSVPASVTKLVNNDGTDIKSTQVFTGMTKLAEVENNSAQFVVDDFTASGAAALFNYYTSSSGNSSLLVVGNSATDTGANGYYFCKNIRATQGTLATLSSGTVQYQKDNWYAIAPAGKEDTSGNLVHVFPDEVSDSSPRRDHIQYDFLNSNGQKCKNSLGSTEKITKYDIGNSFSASTWCTAAVLPSCVDIIGDNAFYNSHLQYLEIHATKIGYHAFYYNDDLRQMQEQYYYIHKEITSWGTNPFGVSTNSGKKRNYIFENKSVYDKHVQSSGVLKTDSAWKTTETHLSSNQYWQIPVYVNVVSEDGDVNIGSKNDLDERFFYDSDYATRKTSPTGENKNGTYKILLTKRLSGKGFNITKQANGAWADNTANEPFAEPVIEGMTKTQWYKAASYTDANKIAKVEDVYSALSTAGINVYTKKVAPPSVKDNKWSFVDAMEDPANAKTYSFNNLLGLTDDYVANFVAHTTHWGGQLTEKPTYVSAAGDYKFTIQLNGEKWGAWEVGYSAEATVKQMEIDLGKLENIPEFYALNSKTNSWQKLQGNTVSVLYEHMDGWSMSSAGSLSQAEVINGYVNYAGANLSLAGRADIATEWSKYKIEGNASSQLVGLNSDKYSASFTFSVKNANYKFIYTSVDANKDAFSDRRIGFTNGSMLERSAILNKQWYILKSANWFINKGSSETDPVKNEFKLAVKTDGSGESINTWQYEFAGYKVNNPALAYGGALTLKATVSWNDKVIANDIELADGTLGKYINTAMPVGAYEVLISAPEAKIGETVYPAFSMLYELKVTAKPFNETASNAVVNALTGKTFEAAYDNKVFLHDEIPTPLSGLNATLNVELNKTTNTAENNYWVSQKTTAYGGVELKYNRVELRDSAYYPFDRFQSFADVPKEVGRYIVYYSISAPNYVTLGGEADAQRLSYVFTTVIYRELSAEDISAEINKTKYTYNGSPVYAEVPYSPYYQTSFTGSDYVNATDSAVKNKPKATLTIEDTVLNRWKDTTATGIIINGAKAEIEYRIEQAENSWLSAPQVPGWSYLGFDAAVYTITGTLTYPHAQVYYRIGTKKDDGTYSWVDVEGTLAKGSEYFQINGLGEVTDSKAIAKLNSLPVNTYWLGSYVSESTDGNVKEYTTPTVSYGQIRLSKATNYWKTTPSLTSWLYNGFSATANFKEGVPTYTEGNGAVVYTLIKPDDTRYTLSFDGSSLSQSTIDYLNALPVASYTLEALYAKTANLNELPYKTTFTVSKTANTWKDTPVITSWQYKGFRQDTNFISGVPTYSTAEKVVYKVGSTVLNYTITDGKFKFNETAITALNNLVVGNYTLTVTVEGETNYAPINDSIPFSVAKATTNTWKTLPAISGWTYSAYSPLLLTNGIADFGTVSYTVQNIKEDGNIGESETGFINISFSALRDGLDKLGAGDYNLHVVSKGTGSDADNYVEADFDVRFTVAKAANEWRIYPNIQGWTYRDTPKSYTAGTVKYQKDVTITYAYYEAIQVNGVWRANTDKPVTITAQTPAGMYALLATASPTQNYEGVTHTASFEIERANNGWKAGQEPEGTFAWIWGTVDSVINVNTGFIKAEATYMPDEFIVSYVIKDSSGNTRTVEKTSNETASLQALIAELKKLNVGSYEITVSVAATGNYSEVSRVNYVTVSAAKFEWVTAPSGCDWTWNVAGAEQGFTEPSIKPVSDSGVVISYVIGAENDSATTTYKEDKDGKTPYEQLLEDLKNRDAKTYYITVTVSCANYEELSKTVAVEIKQAQNVWTKNAPEERIEKVYKNKEFAILKAEAKYGNDTVTYKYTDGSTPVTINEISVVNAWINRLNASNEPYWLIVEVAADPNGNYTGLRVETALIVTGEHSHWDNEDTITDTYTFTYGENLAENLEGVIIPQHVLHSSDDLRGDFLKYTIAYKNYDNSKNSDEECITAQSVTDYLVANAKAGTYTITAVYDPNNVNYTTLTYVITVSVRRATSAWAVKPDTEYINTYEAVEMPTPTANYPVEITVVDSGNKSYELPADGNLNKLLNSLNVGTYTVTSKVVGTDNYTGLAAITTRVVITPAPNAWTEDSELKSVWEFKRLQEFNISVPASLRGTVRCVVKSRTLALDEDLNEYLNSHTDLFTEGDHTLSFVVEEDKNGNYKGLVYDSIIRITKIENKWEEQKGPEATHDWFGNVNVDEFKIPVPQHGYVTDAGGKKVCLLRFDIVKVVGNATNYEGDAYNLTESQFKAKLATLVNGTYMITMHVGGTFNDSDQYSGDIIKLNKDYVYLSGTTVVTVTPHKNGWNTAFKNASWIWGTPITLTAPEAKKGNGTIVYSVSGTDAKGTTVTGGPFNGVIEAGTQPTATTAFSKLSAFLSGCKAGTYTITATVEGTDEYEAPQATTAVVVISLAPNSWEDSIAANTTIEWTYGETESNPEIEFIPTHDAENKMSILVNNKKINDDLQDYLETCGVGTYIIKATVPATVEYDAIEKIITLTIKKSNRNGWVLDKEKGKLKFDIAKSWTWDDITRNKTGWNIGLVTPMPLFGNDVTITVKRGDAEEFVVALTYSLADGIKKVNDNDVQALKEKLWALNVGTYTIVAEIPESADYVAYSQDAISFEVTIADNEWKSAEDAPHISGWSYNGGTAYPASDPKYGNKNDVEYSYAPVIIDAGKDNDDGCKNVGKVTEWNRALPIDAGMYYIRGFLDATANYNKLVGYGVFSIGAGENSWVDVPGVIAWNWNNYIREINQFSASARNGGRVTFSISKSGNSESGYVSLDESDFLVHNGDKLTTAQINLLKSFKFVEIKNEETNENEISKMISEQVAVVLKALKPGTYRLRAVAAATENYEEMIGAFTFTVGKADNEWNVAADGTPVAPNVLSFDYNDFAESGERASFTAGSSKYGTISYQVTDSEGTVVINKDLKLTVNGVKEELKKLNAGNYILKAWVPAQTNDVFNAFYSQSAPYSVLFSVNRIQNAWKEDCEPLTTISAFYSELHKEEGYDFEGWFGKPQTQYGDKILYTLLDDNYNTAKPGEYEYDDLFEAIKSLSSGSYFVRANVAQSGNHLPMSADTRIFINRRQNNYTLPDNVSGQWKEEDGENKTTLDALDLTAEYKENVTYTLNNVEYPSYEALTKAINDKQFNAGSYQIIVTVKPTDEYEGFTDFVPLVIEQDENEWQDNWTVENSFDIISLAGKSRSVKTGGINWTWDTQVIWIGAKPKYGNSIDVSISKEGDPDARHFPVIYLDQSVAESHLENICNALSTLDVGNYTMTVLALGDINWKQISDSVSFTVTKASNDWVDKQEPTLAGATINENTGMPTYTYGGIAVTPQARSVYGEPVFVYYVDGNNTPLKETPVNAGSYRVEILVDETVNYKGLEESLSFVIAKDRDMSFVISNGTVGWTWGEYDRLTHLFNGVPTTGGNVSYTILDSTGKELLTDIRLVDNKGVHNNDFYKDIYVTEKDAAEIGKLLAGNYRLQINVEEMPNYEAFSASSAFVISTAQNIWTVAPKITPWSLGSWNAEENTPDAEAKYGNATIVVKGKLSGDVYYKRYYDEQKKEYVTEINQLKSAPAAWYTMTASVNGVNNQYSGIDETNYDFQIFVIGSTEVSNSWIINAAIANWTASVNIADISMPEGTPLRGLPYFVFYKRVTSGSTDTRGAEITAETDEVFVVEAGTTYFRDFCIPMAPGTYYMVAYAARYDLSGDRIMDKISSEEIAFEILKRDNSWANEPRIPNILYLGQKSGWTSPDASTTEGGKNGIEYKYFDAETNTYVGSTIPDKPGKYYMTATATVNYCKTITYSVEFSVEYSYNGWISGVRIENWSEEYEANDPTAVAVYGTDKIVYKYAKQETPKEYLPGKPTEEGNYIVYAIIDCENDGYANISDSFEFTIEPAYDTDLLIVDIVLGTVGSVMAAGVIFLAIKKRRRL